MDEITKKKIIEFMLHFIVETDKEISFLKIAMNARGLSITSEYMKLFA